MKHTRFVTIFTVIFAFGAASCQLETAVAQANNTQQPAISQPAPDPTPQTCAQWEPQILATTVRIQMQSAVEFELDMGREPIYSESISHATVIGERYLLTHNHFKISPRYMGNSTSLYATLYRPTTGEMFAEAATFTVAFADEQTLLLEFADKEGRGLFAALGIPSAQLRTGDTLPLEVGMEVAQVSWDGANTHVVCVPITAVFPNENPPKLELGSRVGHGSSGGGVFWQGFHIANNWQQTTVYEPGGSNILHQFSSAALNSVPLSMEILSNVVDESSIDE